MQLELKDKEFINNKIEVVKENNRPFYCSTTNTYTASFTDTFDKPWLFTMEQGIYKVFFKMINHDCIEENLDDIADCNIRAELKGTRYNPTNIIRNKILYRSFLTGLDLQYTVQSDCVMEEIIINQKQDNYEYAYIMKLENLTPHLGDDGTVSFLSNDDMQKGKVVFDICLPTVYITNEVISNKTKFSLYKELSDTYLLYLTHNINYKNFDECVFPFVIMLEHRVLNNYV